MQFGGIVVGGDVLSVGRTILIAEDNTSTQKVLSKILSSAGYAIECVADGQEAIDHLGRNMPDLVITDIMMPRVDGLEVCRHVQELETTVRPYVIVLSALNDLDSVVEGLARGADDFICKPFKSQELLARTRVGMRLVEHQYEIMKLTHQVSEYRSMASLSALGSSIAHEVNSPLGAVSFNNQTMRKILKRSPPAEGSETLLEILDEDERALQYITKIVKSLKQIYKKESTHEDRQCRLNEVFETTQAMMSHRIGSSITLEIDSVVEPIHLRCPGRELIQILINLVGNAIEAITDKGWIRISVAASAEAVTVSVVNNGAPIPPTSAERMFEPNVTSKPEHGTGLGLYISRSIAERNGGHLIYDADCPEGVRFELMIPRAT